MRRANEAHATAGAVPSASRIANDLTMKISAEPDVVTKVNSGRHTGLIPRRRRSWNCICRCTLKRKGRREKVCTAERGRDHRLIELDRSGRGGIADRRDEGVVVAVRARRMGVVRGLVPVSHRVRAARRLRVFDLRMVARARERHREDHERDGEETIETVKQGLGPGSRTRRARRVVRRQVCRTPRTITGRPRPVKGASPTDHVSFRRRSIPVVRSARAVHDRTPAHSLSLSTRRAGRQPACQYTKHPADFLRVPVPHSSPA